MERLEGKEPRLGVIGLGQWFEHLSASFAKERIAVVKAAGRKSFHERERRLSELGIPEGNYYIGSADGHIPDSFFDGIDCAYVASPNSMHGAQAMQALGSGRRTVVEKTLATNETDFRRVMDFIARERLADSVYMHLHYLHKQLTIAMDGILSGIVAEHGKAKAVGATFFERYSQEDSGRKWLFSAREGGIFMDWIHPYEVLFHGAMADEVTLTGVSPVVMNRGYGTSDPSGAEAIAAISGRHFAGGAKAAVRVGKGARSGMRRLRFYFDDAIADFDFPGWKEEVEGRRGRWTLSGTDGRQLSSGEPSGPDTAELLAKDIVSLCNGSNNGITMKELERLYAPQWDYQRRVGGSAAIGEDAFVERFVTDGLNCSVPH